jgi:3-hydroxyisobutyrate dehydrogenase-like beta-hydroxyacid dehydrogenase
MSKTAFIGLGAMGSRMAANLLKTGVRLGSGGLNMTAVVKLFEKNN